MTGGVAVTDQRHEPIALALSGGGNRAALLTLGGLLAIVDRGLNRRVDVISSVSGGSITNGVVANKTHFEQLAPGGLDEAAAAVVKGACGRAVLSPIGVGLAFTFLDLVVVAGASFAVKSVWQLVVIFVVVMLALLMASGSMLMSGLSIVYFGAKGTLTLGTLKDRAVAHEFCATDLITGMPVTFSTRGGVARRRVPVPPSQRGAAVQLWKVPSMMVAVAVRASAAFPGVAPKVVHFPKEGQQAVPTLRLDGGAVTSPGALGPTALCADGGNWNNLGTQSIREEGTDRGLPVICINASAPGKTSKPFLFYIPGVALVVAMYRTMTILSRNTVEPRVDSINRDLQRRAETLSPPDPRDDPLTVVADMRKIDAMRIAMRSLAHERPSTPPGDHGRPDIGTAELDQLVQASWWKELCALDSDAEIKTSTKLTAVSRDEALLLLVRGYANTWLASLLVEPASIEDQHDHRIAPRLQSLVAT